MKCTTGATRTTPLQKMCKLSGLGVTGGGRSDSVATAATHARAVTRERSELFNFMKAMQPDGTVLILPNYHFPRRRLFDKWPTHAVLGCEIQTQFLDATRVQGICYGVLKDGHTYLYTGATYPNLGVGTAWIVSVQQFFFPSYPGTWFGEGFNALARPTFNTKMLLF